MQNTVRAYRSRAVDEEPTENQFVRCKKTMHAWAPTKSIMHTGISTEMSIVFKHFKQRYRPPGYGIDTPKDNRNITKYCSYVF